MTHDHFDELHANFLHALSRHSLAAHYERQEAELWKQEQQRLDDLFYREQLRAQEQEDWLAAEEEYERRPVPAEPELTIEYFDDVPWHEDPIFIGYEAAVAEDLLPDEIRLNNRIRRQEGRLAGHIRQRLCYREHRGGRPKAHRRGYDPDQRREWRRQQRTI